MTRETKEEQSFKKIQEIISSERTAEEISNICEKSGVTEEEKIEQIAYQIGKVLLGELSPKKLSSILEKIIKLEATIARKISSEVNKSVFSQARDDLERLYQTKKTAPLKELPKKSPRKDIYREPIE